MSRHIRKLARSYAANLGLLAALLVSSVIVVRYNHADFLKSLPQGICPSFTDFLIYDMGTSSQLSIAWLLAPLCSMACATLVLQPKEHEMTILGHGSLRGFWLSEAADAALAATTVSAAMSAILLICALTGPNVADYSAATVCSLMTGQELGAAASPMIVTASCALHLLGATLFITLVYAALRRATGATAASFAIVTTMLLPSVTGQSSFVSDLLRNLPGISLVENPIHAFISFQSVDWGRWVSGGVGPRLWFLPLASLAVIAAGYLLTERHEPVRFRRAAAP